MKKFLPKTVNNHKGFTLVELLVVISIIAILATLGIALFGGVQSKARDARRTADVVAIAKALEANKTANVATYNALVATYFASGAIPADSTTAKYCVVEAAAGAALAGVPTAWATTSVCPTAPAGYNVVSTAAPAATATSWRVCALLENGTNPTVTCQVNAQ